jgi:hypothetical protein
MIIGHGLVDCLDPVAVFCYVLTCVVIEQRQLLDLKKACMGDFLRSH